MWAAGSKLLESLDVRLPFALFVLLLANAAACAQDGDNGARGDGGVDRPRATDAPIGPLMPECTTPTDAAVNLNASVVDVLIVFDGSESMGIGFGSGTRYSVVADVLSQLVDDYQGRIRFGFAQFPGSDALCSDQTVAGCCAGTPTVRVAPNNGVAVKEAIENVLPLAGNTPTALALRNAHDYYAGFIDYVDQRYVLLATDGLPSCTLSGALSSNQPGNGSGSASDACQDAVAQVQTLVGDNIKVLVLAVGAELTDDPAGPPNCLDQMAQEGGMPQSTAGRGYYSAASPESLQVTLEHIFGGVERTSCLLELDPAPPSPTLVAVYLDGEQIPRNPDNGWDFDPAADAEFTSRVRIVGQYCDRIQQFRYSRIEAKFGCPACVDPSTCR